MIYLAFSIFLMLLVINISRYGAEIGKYRAKFAELEADSKRLSNTLSDVVAERDRIKSKYVFLESNLALLERDYKYSVEADVILKKLSVLYEEHESYSTVEEWVIGADPVFSKFLTYVENLESGVETRLN